MCFTNTQNDTHAFCVRWLPPPPPPPQHICDLIKYEWMNSNHWILHTMHTYAQLTRAIFSYSKANVVSIHLRLGWIILRASSQRFRYRSHCTRHSPLFNRWDCSTDLLLCNNRRCLQPARAKLITMMHTINGNRWRHPSAWNDMRLVRCQSVTSHIRSVKHETFRFCFVFDMSFNPIAIWLLYRRRSGGRGSNNKSTLAIWRLTCISVAMKLEEM